MATKKKQVKRKTTRETFTDDLFSDFNAGIKKAGGTTKESIAKDGTRILTITSMRAKKKKKSIPKKKQVKKRKK